MIFIAVKWILSWLGGGVLDKYLGYLENKANNETERERIRTQVTIEEIRAAIAFEQERRLIIAAQLGHPIAWMPRALAEFTAVFWLMLIVADKVWKFEGDVDPLTGPEAAVMGSIFVGMFGGAAVEKITSKAVEAAQRFAEQWRKK